MKIIALVFLVFAAISTLHSFTRGTITLIRYRRLKKKGVFASGQIKELEEAGSDPIGIVEFETENGDRHAILYGGGGRVTRRMVNRKVLVCYFSESPEKARVQEEIKEELVMHFVAGGVGGIASIVTLLKFVV